MPLPEDFGIPIIVPGSTLGGTSLDSVDFATSPVIAPRGGSVLPSVIDTILPDLYQYFPTIVRDLDQEYVDRDAIPAYLWGTVPGWDTSPYSVDDMVGPEPILQATTRVIQIELEHTAREIRSLSYVYNPDLCPAPLLRYLSDYLGAPLPSVSDLGQRNFIKNLVRTYRGKGTPLSLYKLFLSLGFQSYINEQYQLKATGAIVDGPQKVLTATTQVLREPSGTLIASAGPYTIQLTQHPIVRGSIRIRAYDTSTTTPRLIADNGDGGWSDGVAGSVNYLTGEATFTLPAIPTNVGGDIDTDYNFQSDPFPPTVGNRWSDRVRSSSVAVDLVPVNSSVILTPELSNRLLHYVTLLKPAHVVLKELALILEFEDTEDVQEDLNPLTCIFIESEFGTLYRGLGWSSQSNGSLSPERTGMEFIRTYAQDPEDAPYVYPFFRDGKFYQPNSTDDWEANWYSPLSVYKEALTSDVTPPTTAHFAVAKTGGGTSLGIGDTLVFTSGTLQGECREITTFTDNGTWYDTVVNPVLPIAPSVGNTVSILDAGGVRRDGLDNRIQDSLSLRFIDSPDIFVGAPPQTVFAGGVLGKTPVQPNSVELRFTIGATDYEETDDGVGGFTNTSTEITSASINYTTGDVAVTFANPPDVGTPVRYVYATTSSYSLGGF